MGCLTEVFASADVSFKCRKEVQKNLIELMLFHSGYDLKSLAEILGVSLFLLSQVASGKCTFDGDRATKLVKWFLIFIGE